jgi:hypothetical protein
MITVLCRYYAGESKQDFKGSVNLMEVLEIRATVPNAQSPLRFDMQLSSNRT